MPPQDFEVNEVSKRSELIISMEGSYELFLSSLVPSSAAKYRVRIDRGVPRYLKQWGKQEKTQSKVIFALFFHITLFVVDLFKGLIGHFLNHQE